MVWNKSLFYAFQCGRIPITKIPQREDIKLSRMRNRFTTSSHRNNKSHSTLWMKNHHTSQVTRARTLFRVVEWTAPWYDFRLRSDIKLRQMRDVPLYNDDRWWAVGEHPHIFFKGEWTQDSRVSESCSKFRSLSHHPSHSNLPNKGDFSKTAFLPIC